LPEQAIRDYNLLNNTKLQEDFLDKYGDREKTPEQQGISLFQRKSIASYVSKHDPNLTHYVYYSPAKDEFTCTCSGFHSSKSSPKQCTHIRDTVLLMKERIENA
jgi:hypothetical protein